MQRITLLFRYLLLIGITLCLSSISYFFIPTVKGATSHVQDSAQSRDVWDSQLECPQASISTFTPIEDSTPKIIPTSKVTPTLKDTSKPKANSTSKAIPTPKVDSTPKDIPTLSICSPSYFGINAGPFGARIVLIGENFPSPPIQWFLISNSQGPNAQNITSGMILPEVLSQCISGCYPLSQPDQTIPLKQSQQLFSWVWKSPSFPKQPVSSEFYFAVLFENGVIVSSNESSNFTLLSSDPICVDIINSNANTARCNPDQTKPQQRVAGSTVTIIGTNWLLGQPQQAPRQTVAITATCVPLSQCSHHSVMLGKPIPVSSSGSFLTRIHIPSDLLGTFMITATNQVADPAGSVLTFGDTPDLPHLTLKISAPPLPPSPSFDGVFWGGVFSIVFAIPALVAIVSFFILDPRSWKRHFA